MEEKWPIHHFRGQRISSKAGKNKLSFVTLETRGRNLNIFFYFCSRFYEKEKLFKSVMMEKNIVWRTSES